MRGRIRSNFVPPGHVTCSVCNGSGSDDIKCSSCNGTGKANFPFSFGVHKCFVCQGSGKVFMPCLGCAGRGYVIDIKSTE